MWLKSLFFLPLLVLQSVLADDKPLRVVTEASYPPFESFDEHKQLVGFDIELAKAICEQINRECEFYHQPFDSLLSSVAADHYDVAISALDITEQRKTLVSFSDAYFDNMAVYLTKPELEVASNSVVAVQSGSSFMRFLREQRPNILSIAYPSYQLALADLNQAKIDAVFLDSAAAHYWLASHPEFVTQVDENYPASGLGMAVSKQNEDLLNQINHALNVLKNNGSYRTIYQSFFN
ncbi:arginine ABC transporter substrate-binding protein [Agarivorans sp. Toyoura001]|uniref:transporter substrate-binding domain-containing protein n=1 Tax=Agarivorans sp. Toyoura001 TaxID=2283141 RepID=UPI0010E66D22|nr:transporter substrate-binding domain-containing protein [Agarivorans sp. Toyoura001]GDY26573.1 arginine ABC transporter substrate-binding protein [Agarivorans sp. Toyoura001]